MQFTTKEGAEVTVDAPDSRTAESIAQAVAEASRQAVAASSPATPTMTTPEQPPRGSRASPAASGERSQGWYKVLQRSVVRAGVEMDSPKRGETEVRSNPSIRATDHQTSSLDLAVSTQTGDLLEAVETATNATGQLRVRFSEGWTSTESSTGVQILQRCDSVGTPLRKTRPGPEADPDLE